MLQSLRYTISQKYSDILKAATKQLDRGADTAQTIDVREQDSPRAGEKRGRAIQKIERANQRTHYQPSGNELLQQAKKAHTRANKPKRHTHAPLPPCQQGPRTRHCLRAKKAHQLHQQAKKAYTHALASVPKRPTSCTTRPKRHTQTPLPSYQKDPPDAPPGQKGIHTLASVPKRPTCCTTRPKRHAPLPPCQKGPPAAPTGQKGIHIRPCLHTKKAHQLHHPAKKAYTCALASVPTRPTCCSNRPHLM